MSEYIRVEGHSHLMRDGTSGAIVNTNTNEMKQARIRKSSWKKQQNEIKQLNIPGNAIMLKSHQMIEGNNGRNSS